jgi:hypothetical protein
VENATRLFCIMDRCECYHRWLLEGLATESRAGGGQAEGAFRWEQRRRAYISLTKKLIRRQEQSWPEWNRRGGRRFGPNADGRKGGKEARREAAAHHTRARTAKAPHGTWPEWPPSPRTWGARLFGIRRPCQAPFSRHGNAEQGNGGRRPG